MFSLNVQDFFKGLIMAVGGAIYAVIQSSIDAGNFKLDWNNMWHISLAAFMVYLGKKFFSPMPKVVEINPSKTLVIDSRTKEAII